MQQEIEEHLSQQPQEAQAKPSRRVGDIVAMVVMIVLSVILIPIFAINLTLIIKGSVNQSVPPDVFGIAPLAVTSPSMNGDREDSFDEGALIFVHILDDEEKQSLQVDDIVTFRAADGAYVTHRIVAVNRDEGGVLQSVTTRGDANDVTDGSIPLSNVVGRMQGSVAGLGEFAMFLQTPVGILVFIGVPVLLFIAYDVTRIVLYNRKVKAEAAREEASAKEELRRRDEELERLRALVREQGMNEAPPAEPSPEGERENRGEHLPRE